MINSDKILEAYGPLAVILFTRIEKLSKESPEMFDLCMLNIQNDGLKFIQRVLGFFNFNFKLSLKSVASKHKIDKLINTIPSLTEMRKVLKSRETNEKVSFSDLSFRKNLYLK